MPQRPTMVQLPVDLIERLDVKAAAQSVSRSQLIREAVSAFLSEDERQRLAELTAEAYRRFPADGPDEWGDIWRWREAAARARAGTDD